jgi:hypothetical protein
MHVCFWLAGWLAGWLLATMISMMELQWVVDMPHVSTVVSS